MRSTSPLPALERLRRIPGLESSPTAELIAIDSVSDECRLFAGRVVVRRGCVPRHILLIASGSVEVTCDDLPEPKIVGAGGLVGLRPVLQGAGHTEQVVVVTDVDVLVVNADDVGRFIALPSIGRLVDRSVAHLPMPQIGRPRSGRGTVAERRGGDGEDGGR